MNINGTDCVNALISYEWEQSIQVKPSTATGVSGGKSMEATIQTLEGDRVTLSMDAKVQGDVYAKMAEHNSEAAASIEGSEILRSEYASISINGDLNESEQQDIARAIATIDQMFADFMAGRSDNAILKSMDFSNLQTIEGVDTLFEKNATVGGNSPAGLTALISDLFKGGNDNLLEQLLASIREETGIEEPDTIREALKQKVAELNPSAQA